MIHLLLGSERTDRVHLHIVATPDETVPWQSGLYYEHSHPGEFRIDVNADLLGAGFADISTISFVHSAELDPDWSLLPPLGPVGEARPDGGTFHLTAVQEGTTIRVGVCTSFRQSGSSLEISDPERVRLLVMTHTMGRAEMRVDHLVYACL